MNRLPLCHLIVLAATGICAAAPGALRVDAIESTRDTVVYIHDLHLLRQQHPALAAEVRLAGVDTTYRVDLTAEYQTPAIIIRKQQPAPVGQMSLTIRDGDEVIYQHDVATTVIADPKPQVRFANVTAHIERGTAMEQPPVIRQPDLASLPVLPARDAARSVKLDAMALRVLSDVNHPLISANNNCLISRQTAHPKDPAKRSIYVPLKSQLYDPHGVPNRVLHYLAEIPINPDWMKEDGPDVIRLENADIKIHMPRRKWTNGQLVTGEGDGGLGQMVGSAAVDEDGNLYYSGSMGDQYVVRFNIAKAMFEPPPVNMVEVMNQALPPKAAMPQALAGKGARWDDIGYVAVGDGRLYVSPYRNAVYGNVYLSGVFSFPLQHWNTPTAFRNGARIVGASYPGLPMSLFTDWPQEGLAARRLAPGVYHNSAYYMTNYVGSGGGPWRIDINPDGSARSAQIVSSNDVRDAFRLSQPKLTTTASGFFQWADYGVLTTSREKIYHSLNGLPSDAPEDILGRIFSTDPEPDLTPMGDVTIVYDVLAAMRAQPQQFVDILKNQSGPALAPCYMAIDIPGKPGCILGVSEYGYYLAEFDLATAAKGFVNKRFLQSIHATDDSEFPVRAGLGPYGYLWHRDGDKQHLFICGYTGIASLLYSVGGKPLDKHEVVVHRVGSRSLDGARPDGIKWDRDPVTGIDGRIFFTGNNSPDRSGRPFSNGLQAFSPSQPDEVLRLSHMTRGTSTTRLRSRVVFDADGLKRQQMVLSGGRVQPAYIEMMHPDDVPANHDAKLFFYQCLEGQEPQDVLGFSTTVFDGKSGANDLAFSRDRRFLLSIQHGCILTFDIESWQYIAGARIDADIRQFSRPDRQFIITPDDRIYICAEVKGSGKATFYEVELSPDGAIALRPHVTINAPTPTALDAIGGAVLTFTPDAAMDGSYTLVLGTSFRSPGSILRGIPAFIPPPARGSKAAARKD